MVHKNIMFYRSWPQMLGWPSTLWRRHAAGRAVIGGQLAHARTRTCQSRGACRHREINYLCVIAAAPGHYDFITYQSEVMLNLLTSTSGNTNTMCNSKKIMLCCYKITKTWPGHTFMLLKLSFITLSLSQFNSAYLNLKALRPRPRRPRS